MLKVHEDENALSSARGVCKAGEVLVCHERRKYLIFTKCRFFWSCNTKGTTHRHTEIEKRKRRRSVFATLLLFQT